MYLSCVIKKSVSCQVGMVSFLKLWDCGMSCLSVSAAKSLHITAETEIDCQAVFGLGTSDYESVSYLTSDVSLLC